MRIIVCLLFLNAVLCDFGTSYLKNARLCEQWNCINTKLGLQDELPSREVFTPILRSLLPQHWQGSVDNVLDVCYNNRPRRYMNTCPGQGLLHCTVEQLIANCPEENWLKEDACAPLSSLVGFKYMFSQSRYVKLETNLSVERRPVWFLQNYFNQKCCDLPQLFNASVMSECGFNQIVHNYLHQPQRQRVVPNPITPLPILTNADTLKVVRLPKAKNNGRLPTIEDNISDPMDCCEMPNFIDPSWRKECDFELTWKPSSRLSFLEPEPIAEPIITTTTEKSPSYRDAKIVPMSCDKEICVFKKLNVVTDDGIVDIEAFSKLLDNMTSVHNEWTKAKARVVTKCLTKPNTDYEADCEINKVLACTFDVLSENCPYTTKNDPCKHMKYPKADLTCQISSSKYRPKHRRQFCMRPSFVSQEVLSECGIEHLSQVEYTPRTIVKPPRKWEWHVQHVCKDLSNTTKCLANKMEVLNQYGFLDYFKMKNMIKNFTRDNVEWEVFSNVYTASFITSPLYEGYCNSPRKILNVLDTMIMTCPLSKRNNTPKCQKILNEMANTLPELENDAKKEKLNQLLRKYNNMFLSNLMAPLKKDRFHYKLPTLPKVRLPVTVTKPIFNYGILQTKDAPQVKILALPSKISKPKPLVLLPVYHIYGINNTATLKPWDGILRSGSLTTPNTESTRLFVTP